MPKLRGTRIESAIYLDPPVYEALRGLSDKTRVAQSVYLREAVDDLLVKYKIKVVRKKL